MSIPQRLRGVKILKAVSSSIRLQILNYLFDKGPLSYTELMSSLKMNPSRDAGRFAYHLKFLLKADLLEADVESKKYCLTDMGKMVIDVADRIEKKAFKRKKVLVRTSRFSLENFDANKITNSLIKETKMPADSAMKVAKEAEKWLLKSKTKYLTAPLVREVVNTILIEKGLEEYRHKLTRLGLPVYEVTALVDSKTKTLNGSASIQETAGETVLKEYTLLNVLPRDIADAHLSGSLHISGLGSWILKPNEIVHDLRFFFQNGINAEKTDAFQPSFPQPQDLESALAMTFNVLSYSAKEIEKTQTIDYFNIFLAPFTKEMDAVDIKEKLQLFIANINEQIDVSLNMEFTIPDYIVDKPALGRQGKIAGKYGDFLEESQTFALLILEIFNERSTQKPLLNPKIVFKIRPETFADEKAKALLLKALQLASEKGTPYFVNLFKKDWKHSVSSSSGLRLENDLNGDWETDTLRTGSLGSVTINLPRIAYESERDKTKFLDIFKERLEMANRALEIKYRALRQRSKGLTPFLMQSFNGDHYFRLENCLRIINLIGIKEAFEAFCGKTTRESEELTKFAEEVLENIMTYLNRMGKKRTRRLSIAILPDREASGRLVQLDIERYGIAKVKSSGTREDPFYSSVNKLFLKDHKISQDHLTFEQKINDLITCGNLTVIELEETEYNPNELLDLTKQIFENHNMVFITYNRKLTYCTNCKKSWFGFLHKCPSCNSTSTLIGFDRFALE